MDNSAMKIGGVRVTLACAALMFLASTAARAQGPAPVEVAAGYAWMNDTADGIKLPAGWMVGAAFGVTRWLSIVADIGGQYKTLSVLGSDVTLRDHAVLGGLRASMAFGPLAGFAQLLAGADHASGTLFESTDSTTHLAWQPGLGVDVGLKSRIGARFQVDKRYVSNADEYRVVVALVSRWRRQ